MRAKAFGADTARYVVAAMALAMLGCGGDAQPQTTAPVYLDSGAGGMTPAKVDASPGTGGAPKVDAPVAPADGPAGSDAPLPGDARTDAPPSMIDAPPTPDAPVPDMQAPDAQAPDTQAACVASGDDCRMGTCCAGSSCANLAALGGKVCVDNCMKHEDCNTGCCYPIEGGASVCAPTSTCESLPCGNYVLMGSDGTFLGEAKSFPTTDSVCNKYGPHGNDFGPESIYNKNGRYGDSFSQTSAYNKFATEPPQLLCETSGVKHEVVSKNTSMFQRIDPDELCTKLMQMGK